MAWVLLVTAGLFETAFAVSLKQSENFTRLWWSIAFVACATASFLLLSAALRTLPVGTAYAVWTGIGAAGTAILGILFLGESGNLFRVISLFLIVAGVIGLRLSSTV